MINLDTFIANELGISLNNFIYNSISIFKYDTHELADYIKNKCDENPLIYITEDKIPLSVLSRYYQTPSSGIFPELFIHFNCTLDGQKKTTMQYILYSLNSSGFLEADTNLISDMTGSSSEEIHRLLDMLKAYDDRKGIGCTDVYDFLEFQLKNQDMYNEKLFTLFISNLDAVNSGTLHFLEDIETDKNKFLEYVQLITESCSLSPISEGELEYLEPDATISIENGLFNITINDYLSDCIVFEPLEIQSRDKAFKKEMEKYKRDYDELASILNARKMYLSSVLTIIVNKQKDFLSGNSNFLNPLDQNNLADMTSLSPATISRLLANKFVATPKGTVLVKSLLSKKCCNGASVSYAMHLIESFPDFETMPDSKISKKLDEFGVTLSRRTVNKYKNQILSQN